MCQKKEREAQGKAVQNSGKTSSAVLSGDKGDKEATGKEEI